MSGAQTGGSRPQFPEKQSLAPPSDTFGLSAAGEDWPCSATDEAPAPSPTEAAVVTAAPSAILNCRKDTEAGCNSSRSVASFLSLRLPPRRRLAGFPPLQGGPRNPCSKRPPRYRCSFFPRPAGAGLAPLRIAPRKDPGKVSRSLARSLFARERLLLPNRRSEAAAPASPARCRPPPQTETPSSEFSLAECLPPLNPFRAAACRPLDPIRAAGLLPHSLPAAFLFAGRVLL